MLKPAHTSSASSQGQKAAREGGRQLGTCGGHSTLWQGGGAPCPQGHRDSYLREGGRWEAQPVHELTAVLQPVGGPNADLLVPAGSQPQVHTLCPEVSILGTSRLVGAACPALPSPSLPAPSAQARPCRLTRLLHLSSCALDGADRGSPMVTQHTEGHPRARATHSHEPIPVSGEDGLTWARQRPSCYS